MVIDVIPIEVVVRSKYSELMSSCDVRKDIRYEKDLHVVLYIRHSNGVPTIT